MKKKWIKSIFWLSVCLLNISLSEAQTAYFVDGYHGGKWGHYPPQYTSFMVEQLQGHPDWKINLEIEPVTWSWAKQVDKKGYNAFTKLIADQSDEGRIEYVNPTYGQPYLYNISGESIIRQFAYGMKELKGHFPTIQFDTYSSEEPCFTSALPQILRSFGFHYASLKNPNTCWGGYVRAYGKEMLDWVGPDGTAIPTVPRYAMERLKDGSTWETIGNYNGKNFIEAALADGIKYPVGMCLQDAGWKNGPWLGARKGEYQPTEYTTWRKYFENISTNRDLEKWQLSQEDVQVSLVWGAQVLQRIAQQVRKAENKLLMAEKWATMDKLIYDTSWPAAALNTAWQPLLLAQHHDCWIVPYNKVDSVDWAGKVVQWTSLTRQIADSVLNGQTAKPLQQFRSLLVRNVLPYERTALVKYPLATAETDTSLVIVDQYGQVQTTQWSKEETSLGYQILFRATVPAMGQSVYHLEKRPVKADSFVRVRRDKEEVVLLSDLYTIRLNLQEGGVITALQSTSEPSNEWVDTSVYKGFNELRGFFYEENKFRSSTESPATIRILEQGSLRFKIQVNGQIAGQPFKQEICLTRGEPRIDFQLKIDWKDQPRIGQFNDDELRLENGRKAFYNDAYKLLLLLPVKLKQQLIAKNAPFDVTESQLKNTFFSSWDSIKNNVLLDWVDVTDSAKTAGLALFSDHTTSYAHGEQHPLALNVQYAGKGLWGRNYNVDGPTHIEYSLLPHQGDWAQAHLWYVNDCLQNPLTAHAYDDKSLPAAQPLFTFSKKGYQLSALQYEGRDVLLRVFNAESDNTPLSIKVGFDAIEAQLEDLNGTKRRTLSWTGKSGKELSLEMPRFGFRTIRIKMR